MEQTACLHDIGKIGIPDAILHKHGPLTDQEWEVMRHHPMIGAQIVSTIDSLAHLAPAIRAEHERWDGKGNLVPGQAEATSHGHGEIDHGLGVQPGVSIARFQRPQERLHPRGLQLEPAIGLLQLLPLQ